MYSGNNAKKTADSKPITKQQKPLLPKAAAAADTVISSPAVPMATTDASTESSADNTTTATTVKPGMLILPNPGLSDQPQQIPPVIIISQVNDSLVAYQVTPTVQGAPGGVTAVPQTSSADSGNDKDSNTNSADKHSNNETSHLGVVMMTQMGNGESNGQQTNSNTDAASVFQRSQSLPAGLVNGENDVINNRQGTGSDTNPNSVGSCTDDLFRFSPDRVCDVVNNTAIKKEVAEVSQPSFTWNVMLNNVNSASTNVDENRTAGLVESAATKIIASTQSTSQLRKKDGANSGNVSLEASPLQSPKLTPRSSRRGPNKTVSSILKEKRVTTDSPPEFTGKNRYVNDNRTVAEILKELREEKSKEVHKTVGRAMQNLSFIEDKVSRTVLENSAKSLNEQIAKEAMVMKKVQEQNMLASKHQGRNVQTNGSELQQYLTANSKQNLSKKLDNNESGSKVHQVALRNYLNQRRSTVQNLTDPVITQSMLAEASLASRGSSLNTENRPSVYSSNKVNSFLKNSLDSTSNEGRGTNKTLISKSVCASKNPKLASLLAENKNTDVKDSKVVAGLLQTLTSMKQNNNNKQAAQNLNSPWSSSVATNRNVFQGNGFNASNNSVTITRSSSSSAVLNLAVESNRNSAILKSTMGEQRKISGIETNTAFMPIQSVAEANIVSPIKPQAVVPNDNQNNQTTDLSNPKLREFLTAPLSNTNSPDPTEFNTTNTLDWLQRENSSFVPYNNQSFSSAMEQTQLSGPVSNTVNNQQADVNLCNQYQQHTNSFQVTGSTNMLNPTGGSNSNDGFASMDGVRPPSKRLLLSETDGRGFPSSKRSRHLSDQTSRRPRRNNMYIPPLQPLIPTNRTPSHESLPPMASPSSSSSGYGQCPPESPFSPEVHAIMSNTSTDFYCNSLEFGATNAVGQNNSSFRSMSVPVQNFMQNDPFGECNMGMMGSGNFVQGSNSAVTLTDNSASQLFAQQPQQDVSFNSNSYQQQIQQQDSSSSSSVGNRLLQFLESHLSTSASVRGADHQNMRGDHMISGASVKLTPKMKKKYLNQAVNSVLLSNPANNNNDVQFHGRQMLPGSGQFNMPHPTPPSSHPPTPVDFPGANGDFQGNGMGQTTDGRNQHFGGVMSQMVCGPTSSNVDMTMGQTPSSLDASQEADSILLSMCGTDGQTDPVTEQLDFLKML